MNHAEIEAELERVASQVAGLSKDGFDEDVIEAAEERLADLRSAARGLLDRDEDALRGMVTRNVEVWRDFKSKLRQVSGFLESLQE